MSAAEFLERAAIPADPLRERLLSFMVHEIRNPLASALWAAEMLERREFPDPRSERMARLAARSLRRMRALLEDLFAIERIPARLPEGRIDVRAAVERALAPHDLEPAGLPGVVSGPTGLESPLSPVLVDKLLHCVFRRMVRAAGEGRLEISIGAEPGESRVEIFRADLPPSVIDPPLLVPGGSEGGGSTFALLLGRAMAQRLGVSFDVSPRGAGTVIRLGFPRE